MPGVGPFPCLSRHGHIEASPGRRVRRWTLPFRAYQGTAALKRSAMAETRAAGRAITSRAYQGTATLKHRSGGRRSNSLLIFPCLPRHGHIEASNAAGPIRMRTTSSSHAYQGMAPSKRSYLTTMSRTPTATTSRAYHGMAPLKVHSSNELKDNHYQPVPTKARPH